MAAQEQPGDGPAVPPRNNRDFKIRRLRTTTTDGYWKWTGTRQHIPYLLSYYRSSPFATIRNERVFCCQNHIYNMASFQVNGATIPLDATSITSVSRNSSFRWDDAKDKILIREVRLQGPYLERVGSKEAGLKWTEIANCLNAHPLFKDCASLRNQRLVRERFNKLLSDFNSKMRKEENSSGTSPPDLTEAETALEEIQNIIVNNTQNKPQEIQASERSKAMQMRDKAMKTWSKQVTDEDNSDSDESSDSVINKSRSRRKRRRGSEAFSYLEMKQSSDQEMKKEEIEIKKHQVEVEQKKIELEMKKQEQMQAFLIEQQRQAAINQQQQQQQLTQQMQLQSQMLSLLTKLANEHKS